MAEQDETSEAEQLLTTNEGISLQTTQLEELLSTLKKAQSILTNQRQQEHSEFQLKQESTFLPRWMIRYLLLLSLLWQVFSIGTLTLVEYCTQGTSGEKTAKVASNVLLTVFSAIHLLVVILLTLRVARKVVAHTAKFSFLIQTYLSTILLFAGLYTLCARFQCRSFNHILQVKHGICDSYSEKVLIEVFTNLLYFSISNSTLCGITDIEPNLWYTQILVASQMLLSFLYFTSIITHTYQKYKEKPYWEQYQILKSLKMIFSKVSS